MYASASASVCPGWASCPRTHAHSPVEGLNSQRSSRLRPVPFRIKTQAAKQPEIAVTVGPVRGLVPCSWSIPSSRLPQCAIEACLATGRTVIQDEVVPARLIASSHPLPFVCRWIKLPKIIEVIRLADNKNAPEQPEFALNVRPTGGRSCAHGPPASSSSPEQQSIRSQVRPRFLRAQGAASFRT
jgi:hypothetical protein